MPTRDRRMFVSQSIAYFLRQDYPHKELVIVDNGEDCIIDLVPSDRRIRYIRLLEPLPLGTIRNLACEQSRADWIAHWDDDDWMASDRLTAQMTQLLASGRDACGACGLLHYQMYEEKAWRYHYPLRDRPWVAGSTLIYRRTRWAAQPFPAISLGEDTAFVWQLPPDQLLTLLDLPGYIALIHQSNTGIKNLTAPCWQPAAVNAVYQRLGDDLAFYRTLQSEQACNVPTQSYPLKFNSFNQQSDNCKNTKLCASNKPSIESDRISSPVQRQEGQGSHATHRSTDDQDNYNRNYLPLVSCIMPTYNRCRFVAQAITYFQQQSYPQRELIVVDDGDEPVMDLLPDDLRIQYIRLNTKQSIGAKRNLACEAATGEIIVGWDDDDWYGAHRITHQVEPLITDTADATGLGNSLLLTLSDKQFWCCTPSLHEEMFYQGIIGGTLVFWKQFWQQGVRFPDSSLAEDAVFQKCLLEQGAYLKKLSNPGVFVYIRHNTNSWQFQPGEFWNTQAWQRVAPPDFMSTQDLSFYGVEATQLTLTVTELMEVQ